MPKIQCAWGLRSSRPIFAFLLTLALLFEGVAPGFAWSQETNSSTETNSQHKGVLIQDGKEVESVSVTDEDFKDAESMMSAMAGVMGLLLVKPDPECRRRIVIVIGEGMPDEETIPQRFIDLAQHMAAEFRRNGDCVTILYAPNQQTLRNALRDADGLVCIGHGYEAGFGVRNTTRIGPIWDLTAKQLREWLGGRKLDFIVFVSCNVLENTKTMEIWSQCCLMLFGYRGTAYVVDIIRLWQDWLRRGEREGFPLFNGKGMPLGPHHIFDLPTQRWYDQFETYEQYMTRMRSGKKPKEPLPRRVARGGYYVA